MCPKTTPCNNVLKKIKSPVFELDGSLDVPELAKQMNEVLKQYEASNLHKMRLLKQGEHNY